MTASTQQSSDIHFQIYDLAEKLQTWDNNLGRGGYVMGHDGSDKKAEDKLTKATTDSCKITTEVLNGLLGQVIKDKLFNQTSTTSSCKPKPKDQASVEDLFKFKM